MQSKTQGLAVLLDGHMGLMQPAFLPIKYQHIIHIANVPRHPKHVFHKMIKPIQIHIGKKLTGLVTDGQPSSPFPWRKQVVTGEKDIRLRLRIASINNRLHQPQDLFIPKIPGKQSKQNLMVNTGKILSDIAFQHIAKPPRILRGPLDSRMSALTFAARIGIKHKTPINDRFNHIAQGMVDHPITKRRCTDKPRLFLSKNKGSIGTWPVGMSR
jgi:hypothetical protein